MTDPEEPDIAAAGPETPPPGSPAGEPSTPPAPVSESPAGPVSDELAPPALVDALDQVLGEGSEDEEDEAPPRKGRRTSRRSNRARRRREARGGEAPKPKAAETTSRVEPAAPAGAPYQPIDLEQLRTALKGANGMAQLLIMVLGPQFAGAYRYTFYDQEIDRIAPALKIAFDFEQWSLPRILQRVMVWLNVGYVVGHCVALRVKDEGYGPKPDDLQAGATVLPGGIDGKRQEPLPPRAA